MNSDILSFIAIVVTICGAIFSAIAGFTLVRTQRMARYMSEEALKRRYFSEYDDDRKTLERRIDSLNRELIYSKERFDEINHLIVDGQIKATDSNKSSPLNVRGFLSSVGIELGSLEINRRLVFVLTPFREEEYPTYSTIISAFDGLGVEVVRGDEVRAKGAILSHIVRQMLSARIIIANVNGRNPNVMYELGIAHAMGKDVLIIAHTKEGAPFDISSRRILFYKDGRDLRDKLRNELVLNLLQ